MAEEKIDRRVNRTREILHKALFSLMSEKRYDDITVQDILDRANVGRSTFYAHYRDKEDLAVSNLIYVLDMMTSAVERDQTDPKAFLPGVELFTHISEHYQIFKAMTSGRGLDMFFEKGQEYWNQRITARLQAMLPPGQIPVVPIPVIAHFVSGSMVSLLKWWIDNKMPYPPEQMAVVLETLIMPGIQQGLFGDCISGR